MFFTVSKKKEQVGTVPISHQSLKDIFVVTKDCIIHSYRKKDTIYMVELNEGVSFDSNLYVNRFNRSQLCFIQECKLDSLLDFQVLHSIGFDLTSMSNLIVKHDNIEAASYFFDYLSEQNKENFVCEVFINNSFNILKYIYENHSSYIKTLFVYRNRLMTVDFFEYIYNRIKFNLNTFIYKLIINDNYNLLLHIIKNNKKFGNDTLNILNKCYVEAALNCFKHIYKWHVQQHGEIPILFLSNNGKYVKKNYYISTIQSKIKDFLDKNNATYLSVS